VGILVGVLIVGAASTAVLAMGSPYQDFENAAIQTALTKNMTASADITVTEDGAAVLSGTVSGQLDGDNQYCSANITANGQTIDMETSRVDGNTICRMGDLYTSFARQTKKDGDSSGNDGDKLTADSSQVKLAQMAVDALVGDAKTYFTENGDKISVNLQGAQIPDIVNVALAALSDKSVSSHIGITGSSDGMMSSMPSEDSTGGIGGMMQGMNGIGMDAMKNFGGIDSDVINSLLKNLSDMQNPQVTSGSMDATLNNGYVDGAVINVTVTGTDSAGASHTMVFTANVTLSNIGTTTVSAINTTGKTVISADMFMPRGGMNKNSGDNTANTND
jgi:hypothetical protein